MNSASRDTPLGDLADRLGERADAGKMSVGEMMEAAGNAAYGPLLLLIALITVTPLGSIPGVSMVTGAVLVVLGGQMLFSRGRPWVPSWVARRSVRAERVRKGLRKSRPFLDKVDRLPRPRMQSLLDEPWTHAVAGGVLLMGVLMFPLAFVPWGVLAPGAALLIVSLGLMGRDGLLNAAGLAAMLIATGIAGYLTYTTLWA